MKTPDPIQTTEALSAAVAALVGELLVIFQFDISSDRKSALSTAILLVFTIGAFAHGAWVRGKRTEIVAAEHYASTGVAPAPVEVSAPASQV